MHNEEQSERDYAPFTKTQELSRVALVGIGLLCESFGVVDMLRDLEILAINSFVIGIFFIHKNLGELVGNSYYSRENQNQDNGL